MFRVGTRVKVINDEGDMLNALVTEGDVGTVVDNGSIPDITCRIRVDRDPTHVWWVSNTSLRRIHTKKVNVTNST